MSKVYDVLRVKKPGHPSSYPVGAVIVGGSYYPEDAYRIAEGYNEHRHDQNDGGLYYTVEEIDEDSPNRRPACHDVREDGTIKYPDDYNGRRTLGEWPPDPPR